MFSILCHCLLAVLLFQLAASVPPQTAAYGKTNAVSRPRWHSLVGWSRMRTHFVDWVWHLIDNQLPRPVQISEAMPYQSRAGQLPSSHFLAQYGQDVVLRFNLSSDAEAASLSEAADILFLDVWEFTDNWVDIRLAKDVVPALLGLLPKSLQHAHVPLFQGPQLANAIASTHPSKSTPSDLTHLSRAGTGYTHDSSTPKKQAMDIFFDDYRPNSALLHWMRLMASLFPGHVSLESIGTSYEGREITGLRISSRTGSQRQQRRTVLITGGSHAREWIGVSTATYVAHALITGYGNDPARTALVDALDWVIVPTINPDGYAYTWTADRLWRKNRQPTRIRLCKGIDLDRAWGFMWEGDDNEDDSKRGSSNNPCAESFAGERAFEAAEAAALARWAQNQTESHDASFVAFLDLHSYSQQILYPFAYTCKREPRLIEDLTEIGLGLGKAIRTYSGENYEIRPACEGNVLTAPDGRTKILPRLESGGGGGGSALDWFYHEMHARNAFQIKLRDKGGYGFLLPKEYIVPTGEEILRAVMFLGRSIILSSDYDSVGSSVDGQVPLA